MFKGKFQLLLLTTLLKYFLGQKSSEEICFSLRMPFRNAKKSARLSNLSLRMSGFSTIEKPFSCLALLSLAMQNARSLTSIR